MIPTRETSKLTLITAKVDGNDEAYLEVCDIEIPSILIHYYELKRTLLFIADKLDYRELCITSLVNRLEINEETATEIYDSIKPYQWNDKVIVRHSISFL